MKTKEELEQLKKEYESLTTRLQELSDDELETVTGGIIPILLAQGSMTGDPKLKQMGFSDERFNEIKIGDISGKL